MIDTINSTSRSWYESSSCINIAPLSWCLHTRHDCSQLHLPSASTLELYKSKINWKHDQYNFTNSGYIFQIAGLELQNWLLEWGLCCQQRLKSESAIFRLACDSNFFHYALYISQSQKDTTRDAEFNPVTPFNEVTSEWHLCTRCLLWLSTSDLILSKLAAVRTHSILYGLFISQHVTAWNNQMSCTRVLAQCTPV